MIYSRQSCYVGQLKFISLKLDSQNPERKTNNVALLDVCCSIRGNPQFLGAIWVEHATFSYTNLTHSIS